MTAAALAVLGWLRVALEEHEGDDTVFTRTVTVAREAGDTLMLAIAEDNLAEHHLHLGRYRDAAGLLSSVLQKLASLHAVNIATYAIDGAARLAAYTHDGCVAATLLGATEGMRERIAAPIWASANARHERLVAIVRGMVDPETFDRCWSDGRSMRFGQTVESAQAFVRTVEDGPAPIRRR